MAKNKKKYIWIGIIILLIIGGYYWYKKSNSEDIPIQYKTSTAEKGSISSSVLASGNIIVDDSANVDPDITGTVSNLSVKVGDEVKKGQFLFSIINDQLSIDVSSGQISILQARQSLESAKASKRQAEYDLEHHDGSLAEKNILENKLKAAEISLESAKNNIVLTELKYQKSLSDAGKRNVKSPIDGTVNAVNIKNGDDLGRLSSSSNSSAPIVIGDLKTLKAQVDVNEVDISEVVVGQKAILTFNAIEDFSLVGKVEKIDSLGTLSSSVVNYNVTIGFDDIDPRIKPEMTVSASIITDVKQNVLIIPNSSVKSQSGESYVEVLNNEKDSLEKKVVEIGLSNDTNTEIISGLSEGEIIVTQKITSGISSTSGNSNGNSIRVPGMGGFGR